MIDDKKIEEATRDYINKNGYFVKYDEDPCVDIEFAYKEGAHWAINKFLNDLWHPASEKPKSRCNYLLLHFKDKDEECFEADVVDTKAWDCYIKGSLVEYINIDDLFPKKGGEQ